MSRIDETRITATLTPEMLAALDGWIGDEPEPRPTREQALRMAVWDWLSLQQRLPPDLGEDAA